MKSKKQKLIKATQPTDRSVGKSAKNLRVYLAQINSCLGDFKQNHLKILAAIKKAKQENAHLVVFPEAALFGYPPFDLLERSGSVQYQLAELTKLQKKIPQGLTVLVGCFSNNPSERGRPYFNSVAVLTANQKIKFLNKTLLPTGDVFDESRFCEVGDITKNIIKVAGQSVLVTICEDIWAWPKNSIHKTNPILQIPKDKIDLVVNVSASPFFMDKWQQRLENVQMTAHYFSAPVIYLNTVGAQDELIFDGRSFWVNALGEVQDQLVAFKEVCKLADFSILKQSFDSNVKEAKQISLKNTKSKMQPAALANSKYQRQSSELNLANELQLLREALILGIRDYCAKIGIQKIHLGLSGGIDSALVACLAAEAIGAENVTGIALPGPFNAPESYTLAKRLSDNLKINFFNWLIHPHFESFQKEISKYLNINEMGLVHENLQARLRGLILMIVANANGSLLLSTSNKSEIATGYSTLYGDMCGGLAPIGDLTKAQVYALSRIYVQERNWIPIDIIDRAPSAELRPNQKDQDSLPAYDLLDVAVENIVEKCESAKGKTEKWLLNVLFRNEFKRWQSPPILKVTSHAFGRGRRYPIAHRFKG
jgi:NAD+ synthase (glutamine-hydrolysing)